MVAMSTITVRKLDPKVHEQIRVHAAKHGRSMEAQVRDILVTYVRQHQSSPKQIAKRIHKRFANIGGVDDVSLPERAKTPGPIAFDE
jgi:plasmid stability protein